MAANPSRALECFARRANRRGGDTHLFGDGCGKNLFLSAMVYCHRDFGGRIAARHCDLFYFNTSTQIERKRSGVDCPEAYAAEGGSKSEISVWTSGHMARNRGY